jgi:hypothetical protein
MISGAWQSLGSHSWDHPMYRTPHRVNVAVRVGDENDWNSRLQNLDDEDEYRQVQGFLETAADPSIATQSRHPLGFRNYVNNIIRAPNQGEIMAFMRALYGLGGSLDLPHGGAFEGGPFVHWFDAHLRKIIQQYQGLIIQEVSEQGTAVTEANIRGVAEQGGRRIRMSMLLNAGATAMKAVDLVASANPISDPRQREIAKDHAFTMVRNSGRTIRHVLTEHDAAVAFNQALLGGIFDVVWGTIPGGGTLTSAAKEMLKIGFKEMLKKASEDDEPAKQAENMNNEFVSHVHQLVRSGDLDSHDANGAINGFEAVRR